MADAAHIDPQDEDALLAWATDLSDYLANYYLAVKNSKDLSWEECDASFGIQPTYLDDRENLCRVVLRLASQAHNTKELACVHKMLIQYRSHIDTLSDEEIHKVNTLSVAAPDIRLSPHAFANLLMLRIVNMSLPGRMVCEAPLQIPLQDIEKTAKLLADNIDRNTFLSMAIALFRIFNKCSRYHDEESNAYNAFIAGAKIKRSRGEFAEDELTMVYRLSSFLKKRQQSAR